MQNKKRYLYKLRKILVNKLTLRVFLGSMMASSITSTFKIFNGRGPVELSKGIYRDIYNPDNLENGFPNSLGTKDIINKRGIDLTINENNLKLVKSLTVNVADANMNDLLKIPNLEELALVNFDCLTSDDKKIINSLEKLKNITFQINNISTELKLDLLWIREDINISVSKDLALDDNDMVDLCFYKNVINLANNSSRKFMIKGFAKEKWSKLAKWDKELTAIVESFEFAEDTLEIDKVIEIVCYVTDLLEYDPNVSNLLKEATWEIDDEKVIEYNYKLLESVLDSGENYGICCNYAALTSMLGYYSDIKIDYIEGECGDSINNGHAWCGYNYDGNEMIIDPTFLEKDSNFLLEKIYRLLGEYNDELSDDMIDAMFTDNTSAYNKESTYEFVEEDKPLKIRGYKQNFLYINTDKDRYYKELVLKEVKHNLISSLNIIIYLTYFRIIITKYYNEKKDTKAKTLIKKH